MDVSVGLRLIDDANVLLPRTLWAKSPGIPLLREGNQIRLMDFIGWNDVIPWQTAKCRVKGWRDACMISLHFFKGIHSMWKMWILAHCDGALTQEVWCAGWNLEAGSQQSDKLLERWRKEEKWACQNKRKEWRINKDLTQIQSWFRGATVQDLMITSHYLSYWPPTSLSILTFDPLQSIFPITTSAHGMFPLLGTVLCKPERWLWCCDNASGSTVCQKVKFIPHSDAQFELYALSCCHVTGRLHICLKKQLKYIKWSVLWIQNKAKLKQHSRV